MEAEKRRAIRFGVSLKAKPIQYAVSCRSSCSNVVSIHQPTWAGLVHFPDSGTPVAHLVHKVSFPVTSPVASPKWGEHASRPSDVTHGAWSQHARLVCSSRVTFPGIMLLDLSSKKALLIPSLGSPGSPGCVLSRHYPTTASSRVSEVPWAGEC